jgi:beta-phosphoglucomutase family hydrolase
MSDSVQSGYALIFDMDGVIVDSNPMHRESWTRFNRRYGVETTEAMLERMYGKRNDEIVRDFFGPDLSDEETAARGRAKEALYREMIGDRLEDILVPGVRQFLAKWRKLPMAVASNAEPDNVNFLLDRARLRPYFSAVVDGHQVSRPKPAPDVYLLAARLLGVDASRCVVFEDSPAGVSAGLAAGMVVIALCTTFVNLPGAQLNVDNFTCRELQLWLEALTRMG